MIRTLAAALLALSLAACATPGPTTQSLANTALNPRVMPCPQDTGSRLPMKAQDCSGFGQTFTRQDLQRTGGIDTAQSLELLAPSLLIQGR